MQPQLNKFEAEIAKYLRSNLPDKMAMFNGYGRVNYFIGSKAVDLMMESKYVGDGQKFKTRQEVTTFLGTLLDHRTFHRAKKIVKMDGAKKKFKLDMHNNQIFVDSKEPYVWVYEPTSLVAWLKSIGFILLIVAACLFPLWPPGVRTGIYYLCIGSLIILTSFLGLSLLRHVVYFIVLAITFGKVRFWFLPNLTEDVGFFESFVPVYTLEIGEFAEGAEGGGEGGGESASASKSGHQD